MKSITVVLPYTPAPFFEDMALRFSRLPLVSRVMIVALDEASVGGNHGWTVIRGDIAEERALAAILDVVDTSHILFVLTNSDLTVVPSGLERLIGTAGAEKAGLVYADFYDADEGECVSHALNDYQIGSVREGFDFGPIILVSIEAVRESSTRNCMQPGLRFAGL